MKKILYCLGLVMILGSASFVLAGDEDKDMVKSEKRIGNVAAYERIITISAEKCLKKVVFRNPHEPRMANASCSVSFPRSDYEVKEAVRYGFDNMTIPLENGEIVHVDLGVNQNGYNISMYYSAIDPSNPVRKNTPPLTKELFTDLLSQFLKEKGTEFSVRFLKIEK